MFKFSTAFFAGIMTVITVSCKQPIIWPPIPSNFFLEFTVDNKTDNPVDIGIRNYYNWRNGDAVTAYSEWYRETIEAAEAKTLNFENSSMGYEHASTEKEKNFTLLGPDLRFMINDKFFSSFEIEIKMGSETVSLAGYKTKESCFTETGLCYLELGKHFETGAEGCTLWTKKQRVNFREIDYYTLPVKLVINEDGTVLFEEEMVKNGNGITILPRY